MSVWTSGLTYHLINSQASLALGEFLPMPIAAGKLQVLPTSGSSMYFTFGACLDVFALLPTATDPWNAWCNVPLPPQNIACGVGEPSMSGLISLSLKKLSSIFLAARAL